MAKGLGLKSFFIRVLQGLFLGAIRGYQLFISPVFPSCCRFYPSCSRYAQGALKHYGPIKGSFMAAKRIVKCGPFHPGGYDPVHPQASCQAPTKGPCGEKNHQEGCQGHQNMAHKEHCK